MVQVEEETDELLLMDEELFGMDAEDLPRRVLSDFSIYNAEVRAASELQPQILGKSIGAGVAKAHEGGRSPTSTWSMLLW